MTSTVSRSRSNAAALSNVTCAVAAGKHVPRRVMIQSEERTLLLDLSAAAEVLEPVLKHVLDDRRKSVESLLAGNEPPLEQLCTIFDLLCQFGSDPCPHGQPVCHDFTLCNPLRVGRAVIASPDWAADQSNELIVRLNLGLAYGSGKHATTQLAIEALLDQRLSGARVADVGTGSGILSVIAARCGARSVTALDVYAPAVQNATRNVLLNGCSRTVTVRRGSVEHLRGVFDCIVLVVWNAPATWGMLAGLAPLLRSGGTLLMPGALALIDDADFLHSLELLRLFKQQVYSRENHRFLVVQKR